MPAPVMRGGASCCAAVSVQRWRLHRVSSCVLSAERSPLSGQSQCNHNPCAAPGTLSRAQHSCVGTLALAGECCWPPSLSCWPRASAGPEREAKPVFSSFPQWLLDVCQCWSSTVITTNSQFSHSPEIFQRRNKQGQHLLFWAVVPQPLRSSCRSEEVDLPHCWVLPALPGARQGRGRAGSAGAGSVPSTRCGLAFWVNSQDAAP